MASRSQTSKASKRRADSGGLAREPESAPTAEAELVDLAQLAVPRSEPRPKFSWERDDQAEEKPASRKGAGRKRRSKAESAPEAILEPQMVDLNIRTEGGITTAAAISSTEQFLKTSYNWVKANFFGNVIAGFYATFAPAWLAMGISRLCSGHPYLGLANGLLAGLYLVNAFIRSQPD